MMNDVRYRYTLLRAGEFRLDGGSMFGLIPRAVWMRNVTPDDKGRITVQHNCLLLERVGEAPGGTKLHAPKRVLIETGSGDKFDEKNREVFAMGARSVLDALAEVGCSPEEIGGVCVSHLHFDHAGGLTRLSRTGETPDWTGPAASFGGSRGEHGVKRSFPNAKVFVQRREWLDALSNRSVMTRTYFADNIEPIREQVSRVDSIPPFAPGAVVQKNDEPMVPQERRETEVMPGVFVFQTPGHTWGQQAVRFVEPGGRSVVFTPDVIPTRAHIGQAYSLAYDVEPYTSSVTRGWFLREAAARGWVLCLDHEAGPPLFTVRANGKGWFELVACE
ncbi:MAG: MBL fold metallo-hydrolase [Phycisphaerales bacterium]|nr:MBL fold metallo-hydrolase [Phycisphaerales bacterium]